MKKFKLPQKKHLLLFITFLTIITCLLNYRFFLISVAKFLTVTDPSLPKADAIVVLSGDKKRIQVGLELLNKGVADHILLNFNTKDIFDIYWCGTIIDNRQEIDRVKDVLAEKGLLDDKVIFLEDITSTFEDATSSLKKLKKLKATSVIVISSPTHMRRVRMIFSHVFKKSRINLFYTTFDLKEEGIDINNWWKDEFSLIRIQNEYIKLVHNYFKYIF
ncbi:MAG: YdcF family protein [bacterium]